MSNIQCYDHHTQTAVVLAGQTNENKPAAKDAYPDAVFLRPPGTAEKLPLAEFHAPPVTEP